VAVESRPAFVQIEGDARRAYNELAFQYFLGIERKRAERSDRPVLLILLKVRKPPAQSMQSTAVTFAKVFSVLHACVREVDVVGWYREGVIAGAVLVPSSSISETVRSRLSARVVRLVRERLSSDEVARVDVRVVELGRRPRM
jgi:hypothetical protein